jgi:CRISPR-associated endonuclease/helicase Cas3
MSDLNWNKVERLFQIEALLQSKPWTVKQLAYHFFQTQIDAETILPESAEKTIRRDLEFLMQPRLYRRIEDSSSRPKKYTIPSKTNLDKTQVLALYSLLRLFEHHAPVNDEIYHRMAKTLKRDLPLHIQEIFRRCAKTPKTERPPPLGRNLEKINSAWAEQQQIRFQYRKAGGSGTWRDNRLSIYLVELSRTNLDHYIIGYEHDFHRGVRTFKLSRMRDVHLVHESSQTPTDFDPKKYLENAWGVVGNSDGESLEILLRYSPRAVERLEEGGYANMTMLEQFDDGSRKVLLRAGTNKDGVPVEVLAHIRSWGSLVEVLEPEFLRQMWLAEARMIVEKYA